ncbi:MAG: rhomboid family intramembrane serine protease [Deltaproteobacteria bacterium]|nr:rhomboid family intramembrane serine protease [Deltaproteobacteria bacterium]
MRLLVSNITPDRIDTVRLVLTSMGIASSTSASDRGFDVWVDASDHAAAVRAIEQYLAENPLTDENASARFDYLRNTSGLWVAAGLLAFQVLLVGDRPSVTLVQSWGASASAIVDGELYRSATALLLHANPGHLAANMAGLALFGSAACSIVGIGVGWLLILLAGVGGNLANALLYQTGHLSIGASTAVFGSIGVLAGQQFVVKYRAPLQRWRAWLPLGGGLALLAMLGSSPFTDVAAHACGLLVGTALGAGWAVAIRHRLRWPAQVVALAAAAAILALAWARALEAY